MPSNCRFRTDMEESCGDRDRPPPDLHLYKSPWSHDGKDGVNPIPRRPWNAREVVIMFVRGFLLVQALIILCYRIRPSFAAPAATPPGSQLPNLPEDSWQKYVRAPQTGDISPAKVLGQYTKGDVQNPDGLITGNGPTVLTRGPPRNAPNVSANHPISDAVPIIVVDFGQNMAGFLSINFGGAHSFDGGRGLPGIRLAFSETLQYLTNTSDFSRSDNGDQITPGSDQIAVQPDKYTWTDTHGCQHGNKTCADGLHGFRYVRIYLDALAADSPYTVPYGSVSIDSLSLKFSGYRGTPDTFSGWLQTSDENLNQWWFDSVYTNDLCIDTFRENDTDPRGAASPSILGKLVLHDGAKRDRDPYVGDIAVSGLTSYLSHNVPDAARNVLADLADHQRADGWIPPASINNYTLQLMDYPMWWVVCSYDLYMYIGDTDYINKYYQTIVNALDHYYPSVTNNKTNLIEKGVGDSATYGDYAFLPRSGPVTYYNTLYVHALNRAASIATSLGHDKDAARWTDRAKVWSTAINDHLFDKSAGAFYDGTCGTSPCETHAQDGNGISIVSGAVNGTVANSVLSYLSKHNWRPYGNSFYDNDLLQDGFSQRVYAFISYFEIEARFMTGSIDTALDQIRRMYGWMTSHDPQITVWEGIGANGSLYEGPYSSQAHGWATGIVSLLTNNVLGVRPTGPGFSSWAVKPIPGDVQWAKGAVPGPNGPITVQWNRDELLGFFWLAVSAPAGSTGTVSVPVKSADTPVYVNSALAWNNGPKNNATASQSTDGYVSIPVGGGDSTITVGFSM